jgi:iron complex outermembrane receptor protein
VTTVPTAAGPRYLVPTDYTDLEPVRAPRWDATAGFTKDFVIGSGRIQLIGSANYRSHTWANLTNTPYSYRESLLVIDASIAWQPDSGRYSITVWGRNLTDDVELLNIVPVATLFSFQHPTTPRTYGITLRANF